MKKPTPGEQASPSDAITSYIAGLGDWRGERMAELRKIIGKAAPELAEGWKWGVPIWAARNGNVVAVGAFKDNVKLNFFEGAALADPRGLFNAGLDAKASRAIDVGKDDRLDEAALAELIRAALAHNLAKKAKK